MVIITDNNRYEDDGKFDEHFAQFPYELSPFQKHAIKGIVEGNHVLVTAATGSGKTLPAEFAIRHFTSLGKRVIYCSPIKALSNQKTYDFTQKYPDISFGLLTGDIKTNPMAQVLIMTTEILMNRLFTLSTPETKSVHASAHASFEMDIENDLACVIFDELHYINDAHRGHVWEQSILMLPPHIQMVMLSATLDDPCKFASWVESRPNGKPVVICSTDTRIVPLTHYIYLNSPEGLFKKMKDKDAEKTVRKSLNSCLPIRSAEGVFNVDTYNESRRILRLMWDHDVGAKRKAVLNDLLSHLLHNDMLPAICFVFSRKQVEQCAHEVTVPVLPDDSKTPYTIRKECEGIIRRLPNWREYDGLPEYQSLVGLLEKGIGIHHSGMIPVLREIVEFMISKKHIRVLFATESFAIGLDCPIKTAIFVDLKKHDGAEQPRYLLSHEYTQMAGRAGRRGIDTVGHVIHCLNLFDQPDVGTYMEILCGKPQRLVSKFQIYYSVALNLFKTSANVSIEDIETFVKRSMYKSEIDKVSSGLTSEIVELTRKIEAKSVMANMEVLQIYHGLSQKLKMSANKKRKEIELELLKMKAEHPNMDKELVPYSEIVALKEALKEKEAALTGNEASITTQIHNLISILLEFGIIERLDDDDFLHLTSEKGVIASCLAEINPVLIAIICTEWNYFEEFGSRELAAFFSLFTDARNEELYVENEMLHAKIMQFDQIRHSLIVVQDSRNVFVKESGLEGFNYGLVDVILSWCDCENEEQCKGVIYDYDLTIGDFTKAVLKISTLVREMMGMCEQLNKIELMHKLAAIDGLILKYVTTSQSLYL